MSEAFRGLRLHNTLTRAKEDFVPLDPADVRMYVCGPTVYDYAHIGNARPVIVFDVLFRVLRQLYGADHVTYVRNITDVDDKINARALRDHGAEIAAGRLTLNEAIRRVTETTARRFHRDVAALGCLEPTHEPRATDFVLPRADGLTDMKSLIQRLIDGGHAYVAQGESGAEVLFDTRSMADYGALSKRRLEDQQAGARVAVEAHKRHAGDFVLWKESAADEPGWHAAFTADGRTVEIRGRPGWHIECSAMAAAYLGPVFDIHGGGLDLIFPHHENEIAQSRCAHGTPAMANYWLHNGFLQVEGRKMAKSEGNFVTIRDLLDSDGFGGRPWPGEVLRLAMLMTHYREPIDFSVRKLEEAEAVLDGWYRAVGEVEAGAFDCADTLHALLDDLGTTGAIAALHDLRAAAARGSEGARRCLKASAALLGLLGGTGSDWFAAKASGAAVDTQAVEAAIAERLAHLRDKNFAEADRIRDDLAGRGIQLMDHKDPQSGERRTRWEVRR
ncbi:cysteine--tRNA ligase [Aquibium sp. A9E412]|uniref:cysteine--tRNA ligase n=1 Tax=Aquibium sp. A9E412 TaxID=2976767 RepID=UPI0025AF17BC|nr:cysteine--tRNA ligase [Aquibium sp. A9E412]MDN2567170.1 cysteine--tRNA ligase [Aquibium sp. A9E412]